MLRLVGFADEIFNKLESRAVQSIKMTTQEETREAIIKSLQKIGQESKINFREFIIEEHTQGKYRSGTWTYKIFRQRVSLEHWFSAFSSRKEETDVTYQTDADAGKLEADLRKCLDVVREAVKRKKGMF
jgi:uncharacterized protein YdiU (UPF0061 family)